MATSSVTRQDVEIMISQELQKFAAQVMEGGKAIEGALVRAEATVQHLD